MLDKSVRRVMRPALAAAVRPLAAAGVRPNHLTAAALLVALAAAGLAAAGQTWTAAALWIVSRIVDGLDGELARVAVPQGRSSTHDPDLGGYFDIIGDFAAYAAIPVGVAIAQPDARLAMVFLLATYYLNGSAFLAFSSIAERRGIRTDDRSFQFLGGLAEGTETIVVHALLLLLPQHAAVIGAVFAVVVGATAIERVVITRHRLTTAPGRPAEPDPAPDGPGASSGA